jgi:hypothetical protein
LIRTLLIITALLEVATGFALAAFPSPLVSLLIGSPLDTRAGRVVARLAGFALLTLGLACWQARNDQQSRVTAGLVSAMLFYNVAAATLLVYSRPGLGTLRDGPVAGSRSPRGTGTVVHRLSPHY